jgi:NADP-dependent 3-hydroxy acid dehydrogenase YdfG
MEDNFVLITGASGGIGSAIAVAFATHGYKIIATGRSRAKLQALKNNIEAKNGTCEIVMGNLAQKSTIEQLVSTVAQQKGRLAALINNAGVYISDTTTDTDVGLLEKLMETNVYAAFNLTKQLMHIIKASKSHVFNMCSIASSYAYKEAASYTITKHALLGFSRSLRKDLVSFEVKVTAVLPGAVLTDSWGDYKPEPLEMMAPEDIAGLVYACFDTAPAACVEEILIRPLKPNLG